MIETLFIESKNLERQVKIRIYRPKNPSDIYLYFHDGQNIFDKESSAFNMSWQVLEVMKDLGFEANVIGIHSLDGLNRVLEYLPAKLEHPEDHEIFDDQDDLETSGIEYGKFIVEELIPFIEEKPASQRLIAGSSMGGLASLYLGSEYPDIFQLVIAMSNSVFVGPEAAAEFVAAYSKEHKQKIYLSVGTKEGQEEYYQKNFLMGNRMIYGALRNRLEVKFEEIDGAVHNELAWHDNLRSAFKFLFDL